MSGTAVERRRATPYTVDGTWMGGKTRSLERARWIARDSAAERELRADFWAPVRRDHRQPSPHSVTASNPRARAHPPPALAPPPNPPPTRGPRTPPPGPVPPPQPTPPAPRLR